MLPPIEREWQEALDRLDREHMGRNLVPSGAGPDFLSNDVLGLSQHPAVCNAASETAQSHGVGARGSRLLGGDHPLLQAAEEAAANWIGAEAALLFPTGFQANLGLLTSLVGPQDALLSDRLNHASLIDGARLSRGQVRIFEHADLDSLRTQLVASRHARRRFVVTESLFSMDGDLAPLQAIGELCAEFDAQLIVDEAHAAGLLGPDGRGACCLLPELPSALIARIVTGGKALGSAGAFVLGSHALRRTLLNRARSFIYTTGMPLPIAASLTAAIAQMPNMQAERERVLQGAQSLAKTLGLPKPAGAIVPIPCGSADRALQLAAELRQGGLHLHAVRPPTVLEGSARLRVVVHENHRAEDLQRIADLVGNIPKQEPAKAKPKPWVVVGTDTDVGKTVASAILLQAACTRGSASYWKPIQSGLPSDTQTVRELTQNTSAHFFPNGFALSLAKSPDQAARAEGRHIEEARIDQLLAKHVEAGPHPLIVETAGGLCVPWNDHFQNLDWIARHKPNVVLVARSGLGTLNHTQLTLRALSNCGVTPKALLLMGPPPPGQPRRAWPSSSIAQSCRYLTFPN